MKFNLAPSPMWHTPHGSCPFSGNDIQLQWQKFKLQYHYESCPFLGKAVPWLLYHYIPTWKLPNFRKQKYKITCSPNYREWYNLTKILNFNVTSLHESGPYLGNKINHPLPTYDKKWYCLPLKDSDRTMVLLLLTLLLPRIHLVLVLESWDQTIPWGDLEWSPCGLSRG